jgi:hypothetical protein
MIKGSITYLVTTIAAISVSYFKLGFATCSTGFFDTVSVQSTGPPTASSGPGEKIFGSASKGGPSKNLHSKSVRLTLSCTVTWTWYKSVNL